MSNVALVYNHSALAGILRRTDQGYEFRYDTAYLADSDSHAISLTLPKRQEPYSSEVMFPFFVGLLAEGSTRELQARLLKIDPNDDFGLLLATGSDTVGSVSVRGPNA